MMQNWIYSVGINPLTDVINLLTPWIHLDLFVCPYGRDSKDMAWGTDSCHRLYWDMTPTLFFETLSSLDPDKVVTFDWSGTSEATDCFPAVYEQDPSIWICCTKSGFLVLLYAVRKWLSCQQLKQNPNLGDWLTDSPPHWLPPHHLLACLWGWEAGKHGLPVQSHLWSGYLLSWPIFVVWKH